MRDAARREVDSERACTAALAASITWITKNARTNGPAILASTASVQLPCSNAPILLVTPQPGHGKPESCFKTQKATDNPVRCATCAIRKNPTIAQGALARRHTIPEGDGTRSFEVERRTTPFTRVEPGVIISRDTVTRLLLRCCSTASQRCAGLLCFRRQADVLRNSGEVFGAGDEIRTRDQELGNGEKWNHQPLPTQPLSCSPAKRYRHEERRNRRCADSSTFLSHTRVETAAIDTQIDTLMDTATDAAEGVVDGRRW